MASRFAAIQGCNWLGKGQLISKCLFGVFNFFQKMNENKSSSGIIVVKSNSFVHFLEEFTACQFAFKFYWPLQALEIAKGQWNSKANCQAVNSSEKRTTNIPQVDLFSFIFWKNLKTPKRHFEINWPLSWPVLKKHKISSVFQTETTFEALQNVRGV